MNCTCNRNHVDDDEHAPTCASVLSAELAQLRAEVVRLRAIKITIDTPNEVCDGAVHDTIENIERQYGAEAFGWITDLRDDVKQESETATRWWEENQQLRTDNAVLAREVEAWRVYAEDTHDQNYGFCRPGCTKCEGKTRAWQFASTTDASGALERAGRKRRQRP